MLWEICCLCPYEDTINLLLSEYYWYFIILLSMVKKEQLYRHQDYLQLAARPKRLQVNGNIKMTIVDKRKQNGC